MPPGGSSKSEPERGRLDTSVRVGGHVDLAARLARQSACQRRRRHVSGAECPAERPFGAAAAISRYIGRRSIARDCVRLVEHGGQRDGAALTGIPLAVSQRGTGAPKGPFVRAAARKWRKSRWLVCTGCLAGWLGAGRSSWPRCQCGNSISSLHCSVQFLLCRLAESIAMLCVASFIQRAVSPQQSKSKSSANPNPDPDPNPNPAPSMGRHEQSRPLELTGANHSLACSRQQSLYSLLVLPTARLWAQLNSQRRKRQQASGPTIRQMSALAESVGLPR